MKLWKSITSSGSMMWKRSSPANTSLAAFLTTGFRWIGTSERPRIVLSCNSEPSIEELPINKHERAAFLLKMALEKGAVEAMEIKRLMAEYRIGEKTMNEVKIELGIKSYRKMKTWYWIMPGEAAKSSHSGGNNEGVKAQNQEF